MPLIDKKRRRPIIECRNFIWSFLHTYNNGLKSTLDTVKTSRTLPFKLKYNSGTEMRTNIIKSVMLDCLVFEWFKAHGRISQPVERDYRKSV